MQAVLEKPPVVDETELAAATTETVTDYLKAAAEAPPTLATLEPQLILTEPILTEAQVINGWCAPGGVLKAADCWSSNTLQVMITGVPGNGEPDVDVVLRDRGLITNWETAVFLDWCAERLIRFGWVQRTAQYGERACAIGAVHLRMEAATRQMNPNRAMLLGNKATSILVDLIHQKTGGKVSSIPTWNDQTDRTVDEVVSLFREAAQVARNRGADALPPLRPAVPVAA